MMGFIESCMQLSCVQKVMLYLHGVLSIDGTLDAKERKKRTLFFVFSAITGYTVSLNLAMTMDQQLRAPVYLVGSLALVALFSVSSARILLRSPLTTPFTVAVLCMVGAVFLAWDLVGRTVAVPGWPLLVLVIDMFLVMQVPARYTVWFVSGTVFWLIVCAAEESFRFGLFDLPGLVPQEGMNGRRSLWEEQGACEAMPCPASFPPKSFAPAVCVFVVDFVVTRGFAHEVLKEQASMERTINAVQEIASLLAGYDVEKVAELLEAHREDLPEGMIAALRALEENLRMYKAYLPKTCLPFEEGDSYAAGADVESQFTDLPSSSESSASSLHVPAATRVLGITSVKATLLMVNIKDTLRQLEEDSAKFCQLFTALLLKTLRMSDTKRGMVDVFIGDRVHCSFNASKLCASHATSALHTASTLMGKASDCASHINIGIASGTVLRGDMGCDVMRRFSMVGPLVRDVHGMERAGRFFGCDVLCNRLCFSDAECEHDLRLIPCKVEVDTGCEHEVVAELLVPHDIEYSTAADEWMYMIGGKKLWDDYNQTVRKYLRGAATSAEVTEAEQCCPHPQHPVKVRVTTAKDSLLRLPLRAPGAQTDPRGQSNCWQ